MMRSWAFAWLRAIISSLLDSSNLLAATLTSSQDNSLLQ